MAEETPWYMNKSPLSAAYKHFSTVGKQESVLDPKTKELIRLAIASVFRCNHCTENHIKEALNQGATKEEISEALLLASLQCASTQLNWNIDLFEKYLND